MSREYRVEELYHESARFLAERVVNLEDLLRRVYNDFDQDVLPHAEEIQYVVDSVFKYHGDLGYFGYHGQFYPGD